MLEWHERFEKGWGVMKDDGRYRKINRTCENMEKLRLVRCNGYCRKTKFKQINGKKSFQRGFRNNSIITMLNYITV